MTAAGATTSGAESHSVTTVPPPDRAGPGEARAASATAALEVLTDRTLEPIVEMVLTVRAGAYEAHSADGWVRFARHLQGAGWRYQVLDVGGRNPLGDQDCSRFAGASAEAAARYPRRAANSYPHGYEQVVQFFEAPMAPDLCVVHSASHNYEDRGGHRGEHGSLDVVQSRAPFVLAGRGVRADGMVDRSCRLVDVAPTLAQLLGLPHRPGRGLNGLPPGRRLPGPPGRQPAVRPPRPRRDAPPRGRLPDGRVQPQHAVPAGRVGPGPQRGPPDGHGHGLPSRRHGRHADRHAGQPHLADHRRPPRPPPDPPQRLVGPASRTRSSPPTRRPPGRRP